MQSDKKSRSKQVFALSTLFCTMAMAMAAGTVQAGSLSIESWRVDDLALWENVLIPAFEKKNPVTSLMSDVATGTIREDILDEKVLSAIVEIKVPVERAEEIVRLVWAVEKQIQTVVALGVGVRCDQEGEENVVAPILEKLGYKLERAKTNIGLGRITNPATPQTAQETVGVK